MEQFFFDPIVDKHVAALRAELKAEGLRVLAEVTASITGSAFVAAPKRAKAAREEVPRKGAKRTPQELEALCLKLHTYILKNPGQRIEQIGEGLGLDTKDLVLPIKKLIGSNALKTKGVKRATSYTAR